MFFIVMHKSSKVAR